MKLPQFLRTLKPMKGAALIADEKAARKHIEAQGGTVEVDVPYDGPRWRIEFRGFTHAGMTDDMLIAIADEDARKVAKKRVPAGEGKQAK